MTVFREETQTRGEIFYKNYTPSFLIPHPGGVDIQARNIG